MRVLDVLVHIDPVKLGEGLYTYVEQAYPNGPIIRPMTKEEQAERDSFQPPLRNPK